MEAKALYRVKGGLAPVKLGELTVKLWPAGTLGDAVPYVELDGGEGEESRISILVPVQHARALADILGVFASVAEGLPSPVIPVPVVTMDGMPVAV